MENLLQDRILFTFLSAVLGAILGSFATALIHRMPIGIDWVKKPSHCTKCEHKLGFADLFPIFSFIFSLGRCRYCSQKYGYYYLFIEIIMTLGFLVIAYYGGPNFKTFILISLYFLAVVICAIDFKHYIIPDELNIALLVLSFLWGYHNNYFLEDFILMTLGYFLFAWVLRWSMFKWKGREALGFGDVKFFGAVGCFLDISILPCFLFLSGLAGILIAIIWKILKKGDMFPFGPALVLSLLFCVAFPEYSSNLVLKIQELIQK